MLVVGLDVVGVVGVRDVVVTLVPASAPVELVGASALVVAEPSVVPGAP